MDVGQRHGHARIPCAEPLCFQNGKVFREHKQNLVLVIPENFAVLEAKRLGARDTNVSVPLTYVHDPSSTSVNTKIQALNAIVAAMNQKMTGTPPFITLVATSILSKQYRTIYFRFTRSHFGLFKR